MKSKKFVLVLIVALFCMTCVACSNNKEDSGVISQEENNTSSSSKKNGDTALKPKSSKSKKYKNAYNYTIKNIARLLLKENYDYVTAHSYKEIIFGTESAYEEWIEEPVELIQNSTYYLVEDTDSMVYTTVNNDEGLNAYFCDDDIVKDLRKSLYEIDPSISFSNTIAEDQYSCTFVNNDYVLLTSQQPLIVLIDQIPVLSGYNFVKTNMQRFLQLYNEDDEYEDEETVLGRIDALNDYMQQWDDALIRWETEFFEDNGLSMADLEEYNSLPKNQQYNHMLAKTYIHSVFDRNGNEYRLPYGSMKHLAPDGKVDMFDLDGNYLIVDKGNIILQCEGQLYSPMDPPLYLTLTFEDKDISGLTPCGNTLFCTYDTDFEHGTYSKLSLLKTDGSSQEIAIESRFNACPVKIEQEYIPYQYSRSTNDYEYLVEDPKFNSYYSDIWRISYSSLEDGSSHNFDLDMKTGEVLDTDIPTYTGSWFINNSERIIMPDGYIQISPDYCLDKNDLVYSFYDLEYPVGDLSAGGGLEAVYYDDSKDIYWVMSKNGYYYTTDGEFNRISEPVLKPSDITYSILTPYGGFIQQNELRTSIVKRTLYNANGDAIFEFPLYRNSGVNIKSFVAYSTGYVINLDDEDYKLFRVTKLKQ